MSKPRCHFHRGISDGEDLFTAVAASGLEAARARIGLEHGTLEPVAPMQREKPKRGDRQGQSTDAGHRGGTTRSSDEVPIRVGMEPRGRVILFLVNRSTAMQVAGGTHG